MKDGLPKVEVEEFVFGISRLVSFVIEFVWISVVFRVMKPLFESCFKGVFEAIRGDSGVVKVIFEVVKVVMRRVVRVWIMFLFISF